MTEQAEALRWIGKGAADATIDAARNKETS